MKIRKLLRIALESYYFSLHSGQSAEDVDGWEADANRLFDICLKCGYREENLRKIADNAYWNN